MSSHHCRCETCTNTECDLHPSKPNITILGSPVSEIAFKFSREKGCLSHPLAREYINKDVIDELENKTMGADAEGDYVAVAIYDDAISLIKNGVKPK